MSFIDPNIPNPWSTANIDPNILDADYALEYESELVIGRRSFHTAQTYFSLFSRPLQTFTAVQTHWHGTTVDPNEGSFAVVQTGSRLEDLTGEILRVTWRTRSVFVYVVGESTSVVTELSLARRAFMAIGLLALPPTGVPVQKVEVMG